LNCGFPFALDDARSLIKKSLLLLLLLLVVVGVIAFLNIPPDYMRFVAVTLFWCWLSLAFAEVTVYVLLTIRKTGTRAQRMKRSGTVAQFVALAVALLCIGFLKP
jgi:cytochrome bd-type quinol oxidase subunit 2